MRWAFLFCLLISGCSSFNPIGPIVQVAVYWKDGEAIKYYESKPEDLYRATLASLRNLEIPIRSVERDKEGWLIGAGSATPNDFRTGDDRFKIRITKTNNKISRLAIRVNVFGDKPFAELIYHNVDRRPGIQCTEFRP